MCDRCQEISVYAEYEDEELCFNCWENLMQALEAQAELREDR